MERVLIFANPIAGRGRGRSIAERLQRCLRAEGYDVRLLLQPPQALPPAELQRPAKAAIVIGGDGTLRSVANCLTPAAAPPLLVVPMGTANLMGRHLGVNWRGENLEALVLSTLRSGKVVRLDTARANGELCLLIASAGLDAHVVHEVARARSGPITYLSYLLPLVRSFARYDYPELRVEVDGKEVFARAPGLAFVGNIREYGTGFPMLPHATPTDGTLDVCVLPCRSRLELIEVAMRAVTGAHTRAEGVVYTTGKHVRIESPVAVPVEVDGEAAGFTPLEIELLPERLGFLVPGDAGG